MADDKNKKIEESNTTTLWEKEYHRVSKQIEECKTEIEKKSKKANVEILRVNQLDALTLDTEIDDLVGSQFMSIFTFFQPEWVQKYKPELTALLELLIYRCSIWVIDTTVGKKLQNLKFANSECAPISKLQKVAYALLLIGGKWAWTRINTWASDRDYSGSMRSVKFWRSLSHVETAYKVLSLLNFVVFLYDSKYVTLLHRLLGMRMIYDSPNAKRTVSFEYMNRQLVWHGFTEFLMFFLPLVNVQKIKNYISRMFYSPMMAQTSIPEGVCPVCRADPIQTPYEADCGHFFCYYCLKQNCMMDAQYACPRCSTKVREMKRVQIDYK